MRKLNNKFANDITRVKVESLSLNFASQTYTHKFGFHNSYHLHNANGDTIGYMFNFISDHGASSLLLFDGSVIQAGLKTIFLGLICRH